MDRRPPDERRRPGGEPTGRPGSGHGCTCGERGAQRSDEQRRAAERQRAAEQRRAERSTADRAEIAAAEDFDPLRIRPYVALGVDETPATDDEPQRRDSHHHPMEDAATTMPLLLGRQAAGPPPDAAGAAAAGGTTAAWPRRAPGSAYSPAPGSTPASAPASAAPFAPDVDPVQPRRRSPFAALAVATAVIAVVGTAAFAGGLFDGSGNGDADVDTALPTTVASAPEASVPAKASAPASASPPPSAPASTSPSTPASTPPSGSASPSPSASATSPPTTTPTPPPASTPHPSRPASVAPPAPPAGPTLLPGDRGPEVAELQRRLEEIWLFHGRDDGDYTGQVEHAVSVYQSYKAIEGDPPGVYGPRTRRALEAETTGRGRS
ncbi:peptidoglycan-binding domain-containing protein [Streptomyces sp. NPDC047515]|uniref:peptidoglycan-binding domain-containing protein n=1 Tax=Streptomyces sp. NPDC047515 TaxID=3155380 RepID=UPI0033DA1BF9